MRAVEGGHRAIVFSRIGGVQMDTVLAEGLHFRYSLTFVFGLANEANNLVDYKFCVELTEPCGRNVVLTSPRCTLLTANSYNM